MAEKCVGVRGRERKRERERERERERRRLDKKSVDLSEKTETEAEMRENRVVWRGIGLRRKVVGGTNDTEKDGEQANDRKEANGTKPSPIFD
jgi:hypothetical protein